MEINFDITDFSKKETQKKIFSKEIVFQDYKTFKNLNFSKTEYTKEETIEFLNFIFSSVKYFFAQEELNSIPITEILWLAYEQILNKLQDYNHITLFKILEGEILKISLKYKNQILSVLAARFYLIDYYFQVCQLRRIDFPYVDSHLFFQKKVKSKRYLKKIEGVTEEICNKLDYYYDFLYDYSGMKKYEKYTNFKSSMKELPQEVYLLISFLVSKSSTDSDLINDFQNVNIEIMDMVYNSIRQKKISLATPILCNFRFTGFDTSASCFITQMNDSTEEMFNTIKNIALISKNRGGVGVDISPIRAKGSSVKTIKNVSTGIVPLCKVIDSTSLLINQSGKRSSSITVNLPIWHADLFDFLSLQLEYGDSRQKAMDIFPQITVPDLFMKRLIAKDSWYLFNPKEVEDLTGQKLNEIFNEEFEELYNYCILNLHKFDKFVKTTCSEVMRRVLRSQLETGMPYFIFIDTINRKNQNKESGTIPSVNLCVESFSNFGKKTQVINNLKESPIHVCNLCSLNLSNIFSYEDILEQAKIAVVILDSLISETKARIEGINIHNANYRTIGLGLLGLHDFFSWKKIKYSENKAIIEAFRIIDAVNVGAISKSIELANKKGEFKLFKKSEWAKLKINGLDIEDFSKLKHKSQITESIHLKEWAEIKNKLKKGIRNSQLLAIAPNGATSLFQAATPSVLPTFNKFYLTDTGDSPSPVFTKFYSSRYDYYEIYKNIDFNKIIDLIQVLSDRVDQGISFEPLYDLNQNLTAKDIVKYIINMWQKDFKTIYYVRSIQKNQLEAKEKENCEGCSG